jgi:hypothetical protein
MIILLAILLVFLLCVGISAFLLFALVIFVAIVIAVSQQSPPELTPSPTEQRQEAKK